MVIGRKFPVTLAALIFWGASTGVALAPPGDLDTSFGAGAGWSRLDFGPVDVGKAVVLQPDGKIVVAGYTNAGGTNDFAVVRLNPEGTLDGTYGLGTGWSRLHLGGSEFANAVVLQPDGKIVVAGSTNSSGTFDMAVARLNNPQGSLDSTYGLGGGWSRLDFGGSESARAVALQPDGKIIVAGSTDASGTTDMAVARLNSPQGTLDGTYGLGGGWSRLDFGAAEGAEAMALQSDGKIIVAGYTTVSGTSDFAVARLNNPEGTLDGTYGLGTGWSRLDFGGSESAGAMALQPDGKIIVAGYTSAGGNADIAVARLNNPEGTLDSTYGLGTGWSRLDFGGSDIANAVALQPDGKIVVAGGTDAGGTEDILVARLHPNGLLDSTFGKGGWSVINLGGNDAGNGVALQPDGKIIVAGNTVGVVGTSDIAVARLEGDPAAPGVPGTPPTCAGKSATIVGTQGADTLTGTALADVIVALGGKDSIRALGGPDIVCAGRGNDKVAGGGGNDRLRGERGKDVLRGQGGNDSLFGGPGQDLLFGGPGKDRERQ